MFLTDTNIIGELARPRPDAGVLAWAAQVSTLSLSVVSVEEIQYGLAWKPNARVHAWFDRFLDTQCRVLPVAEDIAKRAGTLRGRFRANGQTRTQADMLIAATALVHRLTLVSRNEADFEGCSVAVLNPFATR